MINKRKFGRIIKILEQVYNDNTVIKEIDFDHDIDIFNSGKTINGEKGLKYLGELSESDNLDECIKVYGDYRIEDKAIILIGKENYDIYKGRSISRIMLNKVFDEEIFYFSINRDADVKDDFQLISLFGDKHYNTLLKASNNLIPFKDIKNDGVNQCQILARGKNISINVYKGYEREELYAFEALQDDIRVLINRKAGKIQIDDHIVECGEFFLNNPKLYILLGCNMDSQKSDEESPKIKDISFGSYKGYIYLKPIILNKEEIIQNQFKILAIAKGSPQIEVYDNIAGQWTNLESVNRLDDVSSVNIRIGMGFFDRLYSLLIYTDNDTV